VWATVEKHLLNGYYSYAHDEVGRICQTIFEHELREATTDKSNPGVNPLAQSVFEHELRMAFFYIDEEGQLRYVPGTEEEKVEYKARQDQVNRIFKRSWMEKHSGWSKEYETRAGRPSEIVITKGGVPENVEKIVRSQLMKFPSDRLENLQGIGFREEPFYTDFVEGDPSDQQYKDAGLTIKMNAHEKIKTDAYAQGFQFWIRADKGEEWTRATVSHEAGHNIYNSLSDRERTGWKFIYGLNKPEISRYIGSYCAGESTEAFAGMCELYHKAYYHSGKTRWIWKRKPGTEKSKLFDISTSRFWKEVPEAKEFFDEIMKGASKP